MFFLGAPDSWRERYVSWDFVASDLATMWTLCDKLTQRFLAINLFPASGPLLNLRIVEEFAAYLTGESINHLTSIEQN
jgi:hypothetical protein